MFQFVDTIPVLSILTFLPLAGAGVVLLLRLFASGDGEMVAANARWLAAFFTLCTFVLSLIVFVRFDPGAAGYQFVEQSGDWLAPGVRYSMGIDGLSIWLVLLTTFLMPICVFASWSSVKARVAEYMAAFLMMECLLIGVFCATDLILFYIFFESVLIPMFLVIGVWGGANRIYAAFKFFLFTLLGSVLMLVAIIALYLQVGTTSVVDLQSAVPDAFGLGAQQWLWLAFFASFAVKMPMWPVHTWLPDAHVEAPTAGSVLLAGVMLKLGGYGLLRFSLPMFPDASVFFQPLVFGLSVAAIIIASLVAFRQTDMKKLIAYSSVAHMGYVTLGIFALNEEGAQGAVFQMLSHGIISSALFLCVGVVYDRMHTRDIAFYGGLVGRMPVFAIVFLVFTLGNVGLPGTSGFIGEILTMAGAFEARTWAAFGAAVGVIFSAVYMLTLYRRVVLGEMTNTKLETIKDLGVREVAIFVPLVVGAIAFGIYPSWITDVTAPAVTAILDQLR